MRTKLFFLPLVALIILVVLGCPSPLTPVTDTSIDMVAIPGVTVPATGATPVTSITETEQYTGTVSWSPSVSDTFAASTVYTATITLTVKPGFTLTGVVANSFTVAGATGVSHDANSGIVTAVFPETDGIPVSISEIPGVTVPVVGAIPVTTVTETLQYTGTVSWSPEIEGSFAGSTTYTATINLVPRFGYTFTGISEDFFSVSGATITTNTEDSGLVSAVFPATDPAVINFAAISGVIEPVPGATPVTEVFETPQYTGIVSWSPELSDFFVSNTIYTATITLTPKTGYTLSGVDEDFFTVAGSVSATNPVNTGLVTVVFPITTANLAAVTDYTDTGIGTLKAVQGGTFNNGTADMTVSSFRMSQYEITRAQFLAIMGTDPSDPTRSSGTMSDPVQRVSWYHAIAFSNKLSLAEGLTPVYSVSGITDWENLTFDSIPTTNNAQWNGVTADWTASGYRLPTEAEWEYAARGGIDSNNYTYAGSNTIEEVSWHADNSGNMTHPVGGKMANELGLHDMSGNVHEWCWDWWGDGSFPSEPQTDYRGSTTGNYSVYRGGGWNIFVGGMGLDRQRIDAPQVQAPAVGFRLVRP